MSATPEQIAAAWAAWKVRHKGSIGPGPGFVEAINAALAQQPLSVQEGWKLVPIEPTEAMVEAWQQSIDSNSGFNLRVWTPEANAPFECWKSMLASAPAHPIQSDVSCSRAREGGTGK